RNGPPPFFWPVASPPGSPGGGLAPPFFRAQAGLGRAPRHRPPASALRQKNRGHCPLVCRTYSPLTLRLPLVEEPAYAAQRLSTGTSIAEPAAQYETTT